MNGQSRRLWGTGADSIIDSDCLVSAHSYKRPMYELGDHICFMVGLHFHRRNGNFENGDRGTHVVKVGAGYGGIVGEGTEA